MKCNNCEKSFKFKSRGTAHKLADKHYCSKKCFQQSTKRNNYNLKRKKGPHVYQEDFEREIADIEYANVISRLYE